jgi:serine-type D-Ala-D-Ala carboxypeptidase (penicillin-binding protein 5/6)
MKKIRAVIIVILLICVETLVPKSSYANSAKSAILIEQESGRILFEKNAYTPMRIASITKIMTAILAIESGKMNDYVTISEKAANTEGSSLYLESKQRVKLSDLVYGLMLRSGNDAAVAIAEHVGGSLDNFVLLMNKKAKKIGMKQTAFANPHGLDDHENHYSTAFDMAILTQYAMKNHTYQKVTATKRYLFKRPDGGTSVWKNKNKLLTKLYPYSTGGKTGFTTRAKRTLVSTASKNNMNLIAVTINDGNDWNDHMSMFENAFSQYKLVEIVNKKNFYYPSMLVKGELKPKNSFRYPLKKGEQDQISLSVTTFSNPKGKKKAVGKIVIFLKNDSIGKTYLYVKNPLVHSKNR